MQLNEIHVTNGNVVNTLNIIHNQEKWNFINNDPQIEIKFDFPVRGIRIKAESNSDFFSSCVEIYYKKEDGSFDEEHKYSFSRDFCLETFTDIHFDDFYDGFRIDLDKNNNQCSFSSFEVMPMNDMDFVKEMEKNIGLHRDEGILLITHDLSNTGAPILAFNIANVLNKKLDVITLSLLTDPDSDVCMKYHNAQLPLFFIHDFSYAKYSYYGDVPFHKYGSLENMKNNLFFEAARNMGIRTVITNTVVSGSIVQLLKDYDFTIISLIHEMKNTILHYGFQRSGDLIAKYSDYIVFPNENVKQDFEDIYPKIYGKMMIRPQGVYLNSKFNEVEDIVFSEFHIDKSTKYIMGSGTAELRKGIDLFIAAAISLGSKFENLHFIWTGPFHNDELASWMKLQIHKSGMEKRIHLLPFIKDSNIYKTLLSRAKAFWLTSREDPFPSVVLEALKFHIPVLGFDNSGGFSVMAQNNQAIGIKEFDIVQLVEKTEELLQGKSLINWENVDNFCEELDFEKYCDYLFDLSHSENTITPDLNVYKYQNSSKKHYYERQGKVFSKEEKMIRLKNANFIFRVKKAYLDEVVLLDTAIGSDNVGDEIIMSYCDDICKNTFHLSKIRHIPTHIYDEQIEKIENNLKILCGTNLIYKQMENSRQMVFPENIKAMKNTCLLGVGMQQIGLNEDTSQYTKKLLKLMLNNEYLHSVRDEQTKEFLNSLGIENVVNTSCPTMWNLTEDHCNKIPKTKSKNVLTTITDYAQDKEMDALMLNILKSAYEKVYVWIQGQCDYDYLKSLGDCKNLILLPPTLKDLDRLLDTEDLDYIGTRLHAGIRSLNKYHRSLIVVVDNRARAIHKDTNLPVIERDSLHQNLMNWIYSDFETKISLPLNEIQRWKGQF